jgi:dGTPase
MLAVTIVQRVKLRYTANAMIHDKPRAEFLRDEQRLHELEAASLYPCAQLAKWASRRYEVKAEGKRFELRTAFQHDRDRIVHSRAFRRLKHKTQVFIPYRNDHMRTRLTHTIEVMQIARTIARSLGLNEDLAEAISLGHDLGHTPFGHVGERTLHEIMTGRALEDALPSELIKDSAGFKHNVQSLRVVDLLESRYEHPGLNLTDLTREGILKHTEWSEWKRYPGIISDGLLLERKHPHFEGQAVAIADEIAQLTHDLEDGLRARIVPAGEVEDLEIVGIIVARNEELQKNKPDDFIRQNTLIRNLIHIMVVNVIDTSARRLADWCATHSVDSHDAFADKQGDISPCIIMSDEMAKPVAELKKFVLERVIQSPQVERNDQSGRYFITELFRQYYTDPTMMPWYNLEQYRKDNKIKHLHEISRFRSREDVNAEISRNYHGRPPFISLICDFIAGMSNTFAIREYERWVMPFHG